MTEKLAWSGVVISVQPRIRLWRSFDQRAHTYQGYALILSGKIGEENREFSVGLGKAAYQKHQFEVGDEVSGQSLPVPDPRREGVEFYKTSRLKRLNRAEPSSSQTGPPWRGPAPDLETYRERGHRRLAARTWSGKCKSCKWGCRMPVEMVIDQWQPGKKRYRTETFCYGPKSCKFYSAGPTRKVPGRQGMQYEELDWVDEDETAHRGPDE